MFSLSLPIAFHEMISSHILPHTIHNSFNPACTNTVHDENSACYIEHGRQQQQLQWQWQQQQEQFASCMRVGSSVSNLHYLCCVFAKNHVFQTIFLARIKNYIKLKIEYKKISIILVTPVWPIHAKCLICSSAQFPTAFYIHLCTAAWFSMQQQKTIQFYQICSDKSILIGIQGLLLTFMFASDWHPFWQTHSYQMHFH